MAVSLDTSEPEIFQAVVRELKQNEQLLYFGMNVKLGNIQLHDIAEVKALNEASRHLVDHVNNMHSSLTSMINSLESKIQESNNKIQEARLMMDEARRMIEDAKKQSLPVWYKIGAGLAGLVAFAVGTFF